MGSFAQKGEAMVKDVSDTSVEVEQDVEVKESEAPEPEHSPAEKRTVKNMFGYSAFVHVGPGSDSCDGGEDGSCADPLHFHGWCRLPNSFQRESIREKALAAKARRTRMLRDPECDIYDILEGDMEALKRGAESKADLVEELVAQKYWENQSEAMKDIQEAEEYSTIEEDLERYRALEGTPEDERPEDEFKSLERHIESFEGAIEEKRKELEQPERDSLTALSEDELIDLIRNQRVEVDSNEAFMRTFSQWTQYICTMKPRPKDKGMPNEKVFGDINHLKDQAAPEVVEALNETFADLEDSQGRGVLLGN